MYIHAVKSKHRAVGSQLWGSENERKNMLRLRANKMFNLLAKDLSKRSLRYNIRRHGAGGIERALVMMNVLS